MSYSAGIMDRRVTILTRQTESSELFGRGPGSTTYKETSTIWANVTFSKGTTALREGALDAYNCIIIRCRYNSKLTRRSRLKIDNRLYCIDSFNDDKRKNTIQITAREIITDAAENTPSTTDE